ncbi:MAG: Sialidase precursor [Verrucomicrobiota bacterium]|jgi:hypothetical protein
MLSRLVFPFLLSLNLPVTAQEAGPAVPAAEVTSESGDLLASAPRRDAVKARYWSLMKRLEAEYQAKSLDKDKAKEAGVRLVHALGEHLCLPERSTGDFDKLFQDALAAGAKDPLISLCRLYQVTLLSHDHSEPLLKPQVFKKVCAAVTRQYGESSLANYLALLLPINFDHSQHGAIVGYVFEYQKMEKAEPLLKNLQALRQQVGGDLDQEEQLANLWFSAFRWQAQSTNFYGANRGALNQKFFDDLAAADWQALMPDTRIANWLQAQQAQYRGWKARGQGFANSVSKENFNTFHDEMRSGRDAVRDDDSAIGEYWRIKCGFHLDRLEAEDFCEFIYRHAHSPSSRALNRQFGFFSRRWGGDFASLIAVQSRFLSACRQAKRSDLAAITCDSLSSAVRECQADEPGCQKKLLELDGLLDDFAALLRGCPASDPKSLRRLLGWTLALTQSGGAYRQLLQDGQKSLGEPDYRPEDPCQLLFGDTWQELHEFRLACGHPLLGRELQELGRPEPENNLEDVARYAKVYRMMARSGEMGDPSDAYFKAKSFRFKEAGEIVKGKVLSVPADALAWSGSPVFDGKGGVSAVKKAVLNLHPIAFAQGADISFTVHAEPGAKVTEINLSHGAGLRIGDGTLVATGSGDEGFFRRGIMPFTSAQDFRVRLQCCDGTLAIHVNEQLTNYLPGKGGASLSISVVEPAANSKPLSVNRGMSIRDLKIQSGLPLAPPQGQMKAWREQLLARHPASALPVLLSLNALQGAARQQLWAQLSTKDQEICFTSMLRDAKFNTWLSRQIPQRPVQALAASHDWSLEASSSENDTPVKHAVDGNPKTIWHSEWKGYGASLPIFLTLEMKKPQKLEGVRFVRRPGSFNGTPRYARFYTSDDGIAWTPSLFILLWDKAEKKAPEQIDCLLPTATEKRFVRISLHDSPGSFGHIAGLAEVQPLVLATDKPAALAQ